MASGRHREYHPHLFDIHVEDISPFVFLHPADGVVEIVTVGHVFTGYAVCPCQRNKVGIDHRGRAVTAVEEKFLPLAHVTKEIVVEQNNLDPDVILHYHAKFLYRHLKAAVAGKKHDIPFGHGYLRANGSRKSESHGAETSRGNTAAWRRELEITHRKHLVLTNVGHEDGVVAESLAHFVDHFSHVHFPVFVFWIEFMPFHPFVLYFFMTTERVDPILMFCLNNKGENLFESRLCISMYVEMAEYGFVEFA